MKLSAARMKLSHNCNKRKEDAHSAELAEGKQRIKKMTLRGVLWEGERNIAYRWDFMH